MRDIYIKDLLRELQLNSNKYEQLLKSPHSLCESDGVCFETIKKQLCMDLNMKAPRSNRALHKFKEKVVLNDFSGTYSDEILRASNAALNERAWSIYASSEMGDDDSAPPTFTKFHLKSNIKNPALLEQNQDAFIWKIKPKTTEATFSYFASLPMQLAWRLHFHSNMLHKFLQLTQDMVTGFKKEKLAVIKQASSAVS